MTDFRRIAVLGPGVLGGSVALAVGKRHPDCSVILWGRNPERVAEIRATGFECVTDDLSLAVHDAELVILAVPVGALKRLGRRVLEAGLAGGACITDVGSVKVHPHESLGKDMKDRSVSFIGSHPMAGSERTGFEAADADLFVGAPCILTNENEQPEDEVQRLMGFWTGLGARSAVMSASEHDRLVARISHLPHILSSVCALVALENPKDGRFAGQGLRDTSRIAAGDPAMWLEILVENRHQITKPLREGASILNRLADSLATGDEEAILRVLEEGQARRQTLDGIE
ncbi:MAG: prephenate dehydrogenase/arogenate dehydrogenase family protein [Roseibacillus sp.]|nr:prephenate dehydrogenase/arogenate dehydrogenase family protein [Roseibacillus sp.]